MSVDREVSSLWHRSVRLFERNLSFVLVILALQTASHIALGRPSFSLGQLPLLVVVFLTSASLAFVFHNSELRDRNFTATDMFHKSALPNRAFLIVSFVSILAVIASILFAVFVATIVAWMMPFPTPAVLTGALSLLAFFAPILFLICRYGTAFPAAAFEGDWSPKHAHLRGKGTEKALLRELLTGAFAAVLLIGLAQHFVESVGAPTYVWSSDGDFSLLGTVLFFVVSAGQTLVLAVLVITCCNAYRRGLARLSDA